ncbi:macro domain-containing protein [Acinetobacter variabilis]|uniref:macro domain-containing protein n=1 Tax=Acinetobacter variabilis TaxID=70346 RepID=UPI0030F84269
MTIQIITGNIWNSKAQTIVNTVNCEGVMGAGIALECRLRFPEMFSKYKEICEKGLLKPGLLLLYKSDERWILNFPTKTSWKLPSKEEYLHSGLTKFKNTFKEKGITSIAFPLLGASHGGFTPEKSLEIMKYHLGEIDLDIEIYNYDPKANDDLYDEVKSFLLSHESDIDQLSKETKIQKQYLETLLEGIKFNSSICQVNQLISLKGIGPVTLEKIFAYKKHMKQENYQSGFDF